MAVLFRYELRKLLNRKLVWLIFAGSMALLISQNLPAMKQLTSGYIQGYRDIYAMYEGRIISDAFQSEVKKAHGDYIAAHSDQFYKTDFGDETGVVYSSYSQYYEGANNAFVDISSKSTVEQYQSDIQRASDELKSGKRTDGAPLTGDVRRYAEITVKRGFAIPVVHYIKSWEVLYYESTMSHGEYLLFFLVFTLLPVFYADRASRMDGVMLCAAGRRRSAAARMLAAACIAGAASLLLCNIHFIITAITYGLHGALLPFSACEPQYGSGCVIPLCVVYALSALAVTLSAMACAALVCLASALFRRPLAALLCAVSFILPQIIFSGNIEIIGEWLRYPRFFEFLRTVGEALPAQLLFSNYVPHAVHARYAIIETALPALTIALCCWLAPRQFLRRRKA